ncbi:GAF domain-containing protein [Pedobacter sp. MC2016-15]|uniref:GAF domain-containing protein n=1 Tax=Pedobacter sp. MC2016-15 TaxID=2994473 RepID=UPI0022472BD0|nr:GAF domain-containing protein [Pedobacter sp. MC2016-15]MCX2480583.1 GAF domain-containing protein [Pedobacter sp. MC2016-15]
METNLGNMTIPENDQQRVEALRRYHIIGTAPEKSFDNISNLAALFFNVPIALINFVDTEEVFVKTSMDIEGAQSFTPRGSSLCSLAILSKEVTVFETLPCADPCFLSNSMLAAEIGFKFYAGAPLITHDGFCIGTICVMGFEKRKFTDKEKDMLQHMAHIVMDNIEMRINLRKAEDVLRQSTQSQQS